MVKYNGLWLLFSLFFRFLISPTGRNYEPIRTFYGSKDVFCFVHVPFQGSKPSKSLLGGLRPPKHQIFDPFFDGLSRFAAEIAFSIRALEIKLPSNVKATPWKLDFWLEVKHTYQTSRWRLLPSWISKNSCHFIAIWPILTKFGGHVANPIWNVTKLSEMQINENSKWRTPPSWN